MRLSITPAVARAAGVPHVWLHGSPAPSAAPRLGLRACAAPRHRVPDTGHLCRAKALALQHRIQRLSRARGHGAALLSGGGGIRASRKEGGTFRARRLATECQLRPARRATECQLRPTRGRHRWGGGPPLQGGFRRDRRGFRSHRAFRAAWLSSCHAPAPRVCFQGCSRRLPRAQPGGARLAARLPRRPPHLRHPRHLLPAALAAPPRTPARRSVAAAPGDRQRAWRGR